MCVAKLFLAGNALNEVFMFFMPCMVAGTLHLRVWRYVLVREVGSDNGTFYWSCSV